MLTFWNTCFMWLMFNWFNPCCWLLVYLLLCSFSVTWLRWMYHAFCVHVFLMFVLIILLFSGSIRCVFCFVFCVFFLVGYMIRFLLLSFFTLLYPVLFYSIQFYSISISVLFLYLLYLYIYSIYISTLFI